MAAPGAALRTTMTQTPDATTELQPPFDAELLLGLLCETGIGRAMVRGLRRPDAALSTCARPLPRRLQSASVLRRPGIAAAGAGGGGPGRQVA
jgi:hypothetical protein